MENRTLFNSYMDQTEHYLPTNATCLFVFLPQGEKDYNNAFDTCESCIIHPLSQNKCHIPILQLKNQRRFYYL